MLRPRYARPALGALATLLLLAGCTRTINHSPTEPSDLEKWVKDTRAKPAPPLPPLPPIQPFETFTYDAQALRDPFDVTATAEQITANGPRPESNRRRQPLEMFPLDSLKMVGTLGHGPGMAALVMAPDKVAYRVNVGAYIGQNEGRVTAIQEGRVDVMELAPDGAGGWLQRPATITLNSQ